MSWLTPLEIEALFLSIKISVWAVCISLPFGIVLAYALTRVKFAGRSLVNGVVHLPLVVPPVVTGYLLLVLLGRNGVVGKLLFEWFGVSFTFNWTGAVIASGVVSFPLLVRAIRISLESVDRGLESAARTLGAGKMRVFFFITLPLITPGMISGSVLCFARSISEFGATITFVSYLEGQTNTIPLTLYTMIQVPGGEAAAGRLCLISILTAMLALIISEFCSKTHLAKLER